MEKLKYINELPKTGWVTTDEGDWFWVEWKYPLCEKEVEIRKVRTSKTFLECWNQEKYEWEKWDWIMEYEYIHWAGPIPEPEET